MGTRRTELKKARIWRRRAGNLSPLLNEEKVNDIDKHARHQPRLSSEGGNKKRGRRALRILKSIEKGKKGEASHFEKRLLGFRGSIILGVLAGVERKMEEASRTKKRNGKRRRKGYALEIRAGYEEKKGHQYVHRKVSFGGKIFRGVNPKKRILETPNLEQQANLGKGEGKRGRPFSEKTVTLTQRGKPAKRGKQGKMENLSPG